MKIYMIAVDTPNACRTRCIFANSATEALRFYFDHYKISPTYEALIGETVHQWSGLYFCTDEISGEVEQHTFLLYESTIPNVICTNDFFEDFIKSLLDD